MNGPQTSGGDRGELVAVVAILAVVGVGAAATVAAGFAGLVGSGRWPSLRWSSMLTSLSSLVAHPVTMTHAGMDAEARQRAGIGPGLLRLSVGIESPEDLVADLAAGLQRAQKSLAA